MQITKCQKMCKYGTKCYRRNCQYKHPQSTNDIQQQRYLNRPMKAKQNCNKYDRKQKKNRKNSNKKRRGESGYRQVNYVEHKQKFQSNLQETKRKSLSSEENGQDSLFGEQVTLQQTNNNYKQTQQTSSQFSSIVSSNVSSFQCSSISQKTKEQSNVVIQKRINMNEKYWQELQKFMKYERIKPHCQEKIIEQIQNRFKQCQIPQVIEKIIERLNNLKQQGYTNKFNYNLLVRVICNSEFKWEIIIHKLKKKEVVIQKKKAKDDELKKRFSELKQIPFLIKEDLLNVWKNTESKVLILVDGNNVLGAKSTLQRYFKQKRVEMKVQAQLRLRWLTAYMTMQNFHLVVFFDDFYPEKYYKEIQQKIMTKQEQYLLTRNKSVYAKPQDKADKLIKQQLFKYGKQYNKIILISADRILAQQCNLIQSIQRSSSQYFIKFGKQVIRNIFYHNPQKQLISRICKYRFK